MSKIDRRFMPHDIFRKEAILIFKESFRAGGGGTRASDSGLARQRGSSLLESKKPWLFVFLFLGCCFLGFLVSKFQISKICEITFQVFWKRLITCKMFSIFDSTDRRVVSASVFPKIPKTLHFRTCLALKTVWKWFVFLFISWSVSASQKINKLVWGVMDLSENPKIMKIICFRSLPSHKQIEKFLVQNEAE